MKLSGWKSRLGVHSLQGVIYYPVMKLDVSARALTETPLVLSHSRPSSFGENFVPRSTTLVKVETTNGGVNKRSSQFISFLVTHEVHFTTFLCFLDFHTSTHQVNPFLIWAFSVYTHHLISKTQLVMPANLDASKSEIREHYCTRPPLEWHLESINFWCSRSWNQPKDFSFLGKLGKSLAIASKRVQKAVQY